MYPNGIIKSFDILVNKPIGVVVVLDSKPVESFTFYKSVKRFNPGIVVGIATVRITPLHLFGCFSPVNVKPCALYDVKRRVESGANCELISDVSPLWRRDRIGESTIGAA